MIYQIITIRDLWWGPVTMLTALACGVSWNKCTSIYARDYVYLNTVLCYEIDKFIYIYLKYPIRVILCHNMIVHLKY